MSENWENNINYRSCRRDPYLEINIADLRKVFTCTVTFNLIKTDSKRTENTHGPRTDEERIVNGPFRFIKRPVPFRFIKRQREGFFGAYRMYARNCTSHKLNSPKGPDSIIATTIFSTIIIQNFVISQRFKQFISKRSTTGYLLMMKHA